MYLYNLHLNEAITFQHHVWPFCLLQATLPSAGYPITSSISATNTVPTEIHIASRDDIKLHQDRSTKANHLLHQGEGEIYQNKKIMFHFGRQSQSKNSTPSNNKNQKSPTKTSKDYYCLCSFADTSCTCLLASLRVLEFTIPFFSFRSSYYPSDLRA
jgi:hypothetical protein